jgi:streptogramin lyase
MVHGGQQPIAGAHVYLLAANTTGYGGAGIAASGQNASVSLLTSGDGSDSVGTYVLTTAGGNFTLTNYACVPNTQVYLYASGGNPGAGVNSSVGLVAIYGNCPAAGNFLTAVPFININEVTTIAAAYAFAGFATDSTHVSSSGTALAQTGIANAFLNAANLASVSNGVALTTTPAGNGTVNQAEINVLANIIAACINSDGTIAGPTNPTPCYTLFTNTTSDGTPSGAQPSDTATAAINIAHNPGANVAALYHLPLPSAPFQPILGAQPSAFTMALQFTGGGLVNSQGYAFIESIAIDGYGDVWAPNFFGGVAELSSTGAAISPATGFTGGGVASPLNIAIDQSGNAWIVNYSQTVTELSAAGVPFPSTPYTGGGLDHPIFVAIDGLGNAWLANQSSIIELASSGAPISPSGGYSGNGLSYPMSLAIDGAGSVWIADDSFSISEFSSAGVPISPSSGYTGGGLGGPVDIALDASGNAWMGNQTADISEFSNAGVAISPSGGYTGGGLADPSGTAIDGAGNVWITNQVLSAGAPNPLPGIVEFSNTGQLLSPSSQSYIVPSGYNPVPIAVDGSGNIWVYSRGTDGWSFVEFVGLATPVITPICAGLPVTPTANGSSNLGTRP